MLKLVPSEEGVKHLLEQGHVIYDDDMWPIVYYNGRVYYNTTGYEACWVGPSYNICLYIANSLTAQDTLFTLSYTETIDDIINIYGVPSC